MSNFAEFAAFMNALKDPLDFRRNELGKRCLDAVADNIKDRSDAEQGSEGQWADNRGKYGAAKAKKGLPIGKGLREPKSRARMLDLREIQGQHEITAESAIMTAGTDDDMNKLFQWFHAGGKSEADSEPSGTPDQPQRHIYQLTEDDIETVENIVAEDVIDYMAEW